MWQIQKRCLFKSQRISQVFNISYVFLKQTSIIQSQSVKVSHGVSLCELLSGFKGNQRINNTMVFSSRLWFQVIVRHLCGPEKGCLSRNRMFLSLISCLSTRRFLFLCSKEAESVSCSLTLMALLSHLFQLSKKKKRLNSY